MKKNRPVPVLMYHSVGIPNKQWNWHYLTCPYKTFENQLKSLKLSGYKSISLDQLYRYIFDNICIPPKSIVFTFDDGYLDNYVFAYPIMKKYGFTGTIFVNPEFIDYRDIKRNKFNEKHSLNNIETIGFLSWQEINEMDKSGVMDIQSHALTHTWYPKSDRIIDFRHPNDKYSWMTWNHYKSEKPFLQIDRNNLIKLGEPVYEHGKSLQINRYYEDTKLSDYLIEYVNKNGKEEFFNSPEWKNQLYKQVDIYKNSNINFGFYETETDYNNRIYNELEVSKKILEKELKKKIDFLCWPGGSATKKGIDFANTIGYKLSNAANDILQTRYKIKNNSDFKINRLNRFAPVIFFNNNENSKSKIVYSNGFILKMQLNAFVKDGFSSLLNKVLLKGLKNYYLFIKIFK